MLHDGTANHIKLYKELEREEGGRRRKSKVKSSKFPFESKKLFKSSISFANFVVVFSKNFIKNS